MTNASESAPPSPAPTSQPAPKRFQCRHILTSGRRCRSASLRGEQFCYYHHTTRRPAPRHRGVRPEHAVFELPAIDDRAGVQFALAQVLARLTTDQLDPRRANPILYALKLAIWNLREPRPAAARSDSRGSASSRDSASASSDNFNHPEDIVEELVRDSDLGPIAPIAELPPPQDPKPPPQPPPKTAAAASPASSTTSSLPTPPPSPTPPNVRVPHPRPAVPSPDRVG